MSRTVLLTSSSDPFLMSLCYRMFKERFYDEVNSFRINLNNCSRFPVEVTQELISNLIKDPKVKLIYRPEGGDPGQAIRELLITATEDTVMLLEEDAYIFNPGTVDKYFSMIESGETDLIGSPRGSCGNEIWDVSGKKYGLDYTKYGDNGANFWPNFLFCKRKDMLKTDLNFGSKLFPAGSYCKELDYTFKEDNCGDTFVWASMQLRALGLKVTEVTQHKADPYEVQNKEAGDMNWRLMPFDWIHAGSLSSGYGTYLSGQIPNIVDDGGKQEMETRCAWWSIAAMTTQGFDKFKTDYLQGVSSLVKNANLNLERIEKKVNLYRELLRI